MPFTRRQRRLALASALVAIATFAWLLTRPAADSQKFYSFLSQHPGLSQVVRVGFVIVGKQDEFDVEIAFASLGELIIDGVELGPNLQNLDLDQPPPPPIASDLP